jgi:hypothetical protein
MGDLMLYGMSIKRLTADYKEPWVIRRQRVSPPDAVMMARENYAAKEWEAEIARVGAEAHAAMDDLCYLPGGPARANGPSKDQEEIARKRYGSAPATGVSSTNVGPPHLCAGDPVGIAPNDLAHPSIWKIGKNKMGFIVVAVLAGLVFYLLAKWIG